MTKLFIFISKSTSCLNIYTTEALDDDDVVEIAFILFFAWMKSSLISSKF